MPTKRPAPAPRPLQRPWSRWRNQPGWLLLPLRGFLGVTFAYAGLQKLANPGYLDPASPASVTHQMLLLKHSSPIGWLLGLSAHAPTLVGLLIAFGELAVGLGTLAGLWVRAAAAGGAVLSATFFLTVSWTTSPYYYGSDIVFVFAWLVMIGFGDGGVLSVETWLRTRARRDLSLDPEPAAATVSVPRLWSLCPRGTGCGLTTDGACTRLAGCPIYTERPLPPAKRGELTRRTALLAGAATAIAGVLTLAIGGVTAAAGRLIGGNRKVSTPPSPAALAAPTKHPVPTTVGAPAPASSAGTGHSPSRSSATSDSPRPVVPTTAAAPAGTAVVAAASIPVGQGVPFTDPTDGSPGWVVHPATQTFLAFSAVCTHAGCTVEYDPSTVAFVCPCHGGVFDARTGQVLQGPPPSPLPAIPIHLVNGEIRTG